MNSFSFGRVRQYVVKLWFPVFSDIYHMLSEAFSENSKFGEVLRILQNPSNQMLSEAFSEN